MFWGAGMFGALAALLVLGAQSLYLQRQPDEGLPREHYYGTPFRIVEDESFPLFPNLTHCPPGSITAVGHSDGFGAEWTAMLTLYNYARNHNISFCASGWNSRLDRDVNGSALFSFIGGRLYGPPPRDNKASNARRMSQTCNQVLSRQVREEVRYFYWHAEDPKPELTYFAGDDPASLRVAWHVRRGDVLDSCESNCGWRLLNDAQIKHGMDVLRHRYGDRLQRIHIFTDGRPDEFKDVLHFCSAKNLSCELHAGQSLPTSAVERAAGIGQSAVEKRDVAADFHHMASADVLVMARSTFSGMAGVINAKDVFDAHALAEEPLENLTRARLAQALSDDKKASHLLVVQMRKAEREGKGVAELIGPIGRICPDEPGGDPITNHP